MNKPLRGYQRTSIENVYSAWCRTKSVLLVVPTGGGKTRIAEEIISREVSLGGSVTFIVHRDELVKQSAISFSARLGAENVGVIAAGNRRSPHARVQVASVQTMLARGERPSATLIIFDEAHHYVAAEWSKIKNDYPDTRVLGLTATPERSDGKPLGDIFDELVVGATYSTLIAHGNLVPCEVYQSPQYLMGADMALDPLTAYKRYAEDSSGFVFVASISQAIDQARLFSDNGIPSESIHAKTKKSDRVQILQRFTDGETRLLFNVFALTEGVDVPRARVCMLARGCDHVGAYLQMVGRVLRPHESKSNAILIDLKGVSIQHGVPTIDREYSLTGEGIRPATATSTKTCPKCGYTFDGTWPCKCGFFPQKDPRSEPVIHCLDLKRVFAGGATPEHAKEAEYQRLRTLSKSRGYSMGFVAREYKKLFGKSPVFSDATIDEQKEEYARLLSLAEKKGWKQGYASWRFKATFGKWPNRVWQK